MPQVLVSFGPVPSPSSGNHPSATCFPRNVACYIATEVREGVMLANPTFAPWCQTNPLFTRPKKGSIDRWIIMDLSWLLPRAHSINGGTPKESFLGAFRKMHLPSPSDLCDLMRKTGRGFFLYSTDVVRVYWQLPLDPMDWPLVCFSFDGSYYADVSLPCGLRWAASHYQDITNIIARAANCHGAASILNYIDDFGGVAKDRTSVLPHFTYLQELLARVGNHTRQAQGLRPPLPLRFSSLSPCL